MMHLFTSCSAQPPNSSLYLRHIPKRIDKALSFRADVIEGNTGWGLHFVENLNTSLAVTVLFAISLILGIVFAVCWSILKKDVQGAFGVASYVTSVVTLAVMTWRMWSIYKPIPSKFRKQSEVGFQEGFLVKTPHSQPVIRDPSRHQHMLATQCQPRHHSHSRFGPCS
ncbi:hypothetical protein DL95DRAFT_378835 [Leptodontidium sp. 2 PMI_412]|nr:hypothetical protein DL95DRAFT_378835 [Leptodontidium sp. 2 PMI_412]